jgi:hypothetical protein
MHLIECPHCHTQVLPTKDNLCPACRNDLADLAGVNTNEAALVVHEGQELPSYCMTCNLWTDRYVEVTSDPKTPLDSILDGIFFLNLKSDQSSHAGTTKIYVELPQCEDCAKSGRPNPVEVDYENQTMTFLAHTGFRARVVPTRKQNDQPNEELPDDEEQAS